MIGISHLSRYSSSLNMACNHLKRFESSHVDARFANKWFCSDYVQVFPNFLSIDEGKAVSDDVTELMRRRRYQKGHWDAGKLFRIF